MGDRILALDPGATTGYVVYDAGEKRVVAYGEFEGHDQVILWATRPVDIVTMERLVPHGASYPQVVEAAYASGRMAGEIPVLVHEIRRTDVRSILQTAVHGAIQVRDDKSVWAAVKELHGGESADEKGGPLHGVKSHSRAALAVAVAFGLRQSQATAVAR